MIETISRGDAALHRRSMALLGVLVAVAGCGGPGERQAPPRRTGPAPASPTASADAYVDATAASGLDFVHFNGMSGGFYMAEITGAGGALFDYDGDGDLDLYLVQGAMLGPRKTWKDALVQPPSPPPLSDRLFRNDASAGPDGTLVPHFVDVTRRAGIEQTGYGMGVAAGDYDGDGAVDLYITNEGPNHLLHNQGDGTFVDVTARAGVGDDRWSVPAVFFDYDGDGRLDLFVGNYLVQDYRKMPVCRDLTGALDYCGPQNFTPLPDRLFHNLGDGRFADVTRSAGLTGGFGPALGVVAADFDSDGRLDLYVTNDATANNLWINRGDGTFEDEALLAGCAVNGAGQAESSMGVDAGDYDGDGDLDLFMTHLVSQTNTLYQNDGHGNFRDATDVSGLGAPSRLHTAFGTSWTDYDDDGWLDLFVANGAVKKIEALARQGDPFPLHEPNQLFRNLGDGRFEDVSARSGPVFTVSEVSRAAIFGDLDNDGDEDVVVSNNSGPARLLLDQVGNRNHWLEVHLLHGEPPQESPGAHAAILGAVHPQLDRRVRIDASFASANDPRLLFGLGGRAGPQDLRVVWPGGAVDRWLGVPEERIVIVRRQSENGRRR